MDADTCGHCGGTELLAIGVILRRRAERRPMEIEIRGGAHIHIAKSAHLVVRGAIGKVTIGDGAEIDIEGTLEIEQPGDPTKKRPS